MDIDIDIDIDVEVDVDIDRHFGCFQGASKSVMHSLWYRAVIVYTDFDISEIASPAIQNSKWNQRLLDQVSSFFLKSSATET